MNMERHATLVRYVLVGGVSYLSEMASLYALRHIFNLSAVSAVAISFWIGFVIAFCLQKIFTYKNYEREIKAISRQLAAYGLLTVWNYVFTLVVVRALGERTSVFVARTLAIAVITSWNYLIYKRLFRQPQAV